MIVDSKAGVSIVIKNERQYKITKVKLEDLAAALAGIDRHDPNLHPRQILGRVNSLERTIGDLQAEIDEYDRLKNGEVAEIEVKFLAELPTALIKARIAKGLTQKPTSRANWHSRATSPTL
jgi:HTH-type transcriptional regulator / antitoxin HipB